jgi:hypothetical protein
VGEEYGMYAVDEKCINNFRKKFEGKEPLGRSGHS